MAYNKQNFVDGKVLAAGQLNAMDTQIKNNETNINSKYTKPTTGIPAYDLSQDVQNKLNNAGSGSGSGSSVTVDSALSSTSTNPVQNKVINAELEGVKETYQSLSNTVSALMNYIKSHVVNDDNGAGLDAIIGGDTPVTPPSQTVTVSVSGSTMNVTGFTATTVTQSGSTLNVA